MTVRGTRLQQGILVCLSVVALALGGTFVAEGATGAKFYVDCASGNDANSGKDTAHPWRTLARVNGVTYAAGSTISFKSGTRCAGTLAPQGSGTSSAPNVITSYGSGDRPGIDGQGASAAVLLRNVHDWVLTNLDVTDTGPPPADGEGRVGVFVLLQDYGTGRNYTIANVNVHDVNGCFCHYPAADSGGIIFHAGGSTVPTGFAGINVVANTINMVDVEGLATTSDWQKRDRNPAGPGTTWVPFTGVQIVANTITHIGGDGLLVMNGQGAMVQFNTIDGFNERSGNFNAGMLSYNSDNTVFQYNTVAHGVTPGMAFDHDGASGGTIFQYNFSHDNGGGFFLACTQSQEKSGDGIVRYNVSQNDIPGLPFLGVITLPCNPFQNEKIYNNTIYAPGAGAIVANSSGTVATLSNNIFVGSSSAIFDAQSTFSHNVYWNVSAPAGDTAAVVADPALVAPGTASGLFDATGYELHPGSPAIGAGVTAPGNGGHDYYGNPVSTPPNIGAYEGTGS